MRCLFAVFGLWLTFVAAPVHAVPSVWGSVYASFSPVQHILTSSGTETIPTGATQVVAEVWAGGGTGYGGGTGNVGGGGSGSFGTKTFALTSGNWGQTFVCTVGLGGPAVGAFTNGSNGGASSIVNGTFGTATNIAANGGAFSNAGAAGAGGTAGSGGTTNTTGNAGQGNRTGGATGGAGVVSGSTGLSAGDGGDGAGNASGGAGSNGQCVFTYT